MNEAAAGALQDAGEDMHGRSPDTLPGLDRTRLQRYLDTRFPGLASGPLSAVLLEGGRSNLTYLVDDGVSRWVVRRPPLGHVLPTAHDMAREYRILQGLADSPVPVPRPIAMCADESVLGAPFYVMEFVRGTAYRSDSQLTSVGPARTRRIAEALVEMLVVVHGVDPAGAGLDDLGRPDGYLERQLSRFTAQLAASHSRELPCIERLARRLGKQVPTAGSSAIIHGDYRLDNVLIDEERVSAVLDWEMSTIGDPITDLALLVCYGEAARAGVFGEVGSAPGYPQAAELVHLYADAGGRDVSSLPWYLGFAYFKLAVIAEGIHHRFARGETVGSGFDLVGAAVRPLVELGQEALEQP